MQPIGRRSLSESMGITERVLRTETDLLKQLDLINTSKSGMTLTKKEKKFIKVLRTSWINFRNASDRKNWLSILGINVVSWYQETVKNSLKWRMLLVKH